MENLTYQDIQTLTFPAGTGQAKYKFLKLSSGSVVPCGAGQQAIGVSLLDFNVGYACSVITAGVVPVTIGSGGVTEGAEVVSDASGNAVLATPLALTAGATAVTSNAATPTLTGGALPQKVLGIALSAGNENDIVLIKLK